MKLRLPPVLLLLGVLVVLLNGCKKKDLPDLSCPLATENNPKLRGNETSNFTADVPLKWYALTLRLSAATPNQSAGPIISRTFGYMGLALYESVVPGMPQHQSIQSQLNGLAVLPKLQCGEQCYYPACANAALADMIRHLLGNTSGAQNATIDSLESTLNALFASAVSKQVYDRSVSFGKAISDAIYQWSTTDGGDRAYLNLYPTSYKLPIGPGIWVPLPGQFAQVPYWGDNRTFIKDIATSTQPPPPPAYSTDPASKYYQDELEVYNESIEQDPEHRNIALYWAALPPPCVSLSILNSVLITNKSNLATAAEAYCKVGIATADAIVSCYKTKYTYVQERPINFIRANFNPAWNSLIPTPPFPDYSSAHSVQTGAVARVLADIFGDNTAFTDFSINDLGFTPRSFKKFSDYAYEVGLSRIYGGIHVRTSDFVGLDQGNLVGTRVSALRFEKNNTEF